MFPIELACELGNTDTMKSLIESGAENVVIQGKSILDKLLAAGNMAGAEQLLQLGLTMSIDPVSKRTELHKWVHKPDYYTMLSKYINSSTIAGAVDSWGYKSSDLM